MFTMFLDYASLVLVVPRRFILGLRNHIFTFFTFSKKQPAGGSSYYATGLPQPRPSYFVKIVVTLHLKAFLETFKMEKYKNLASFNTTFKNLLLQIYST